MAPYWPAQMPSDAFVTSMSPLYVNAAMSVLIPTDPGPGGASKRAPFGGSGGPAAGRYGLWGVTDWGVGLCPSELDDLSGSVWRSCGAPRRPPAPIHLPVHTLRSHWDGTSAPPPATTGFGGGAGRNLGGGGGRGGGEGKRTLSSRKNRPARPRSPFSAYCSPNPPRSSSPPPAPRFPLVPRMGVSAGLHLLRPDDRLGAWKTERSAGR